MNEVKINNLRLFNCDCMDYLKTLEDNAFDLAIVDPPYGIGKKNTLHRLSRYGQTETVNDIGVNDQYFKELFRVSKNQVVWGGNYFNMPPTRGFIFWFKHQPVKSYADGEYAWTSFNRNAACFNFPYFGVHNRDNTRIHPTQKPVKLYEWLLTNYAKEGDKILDTHLGSGSSAIAAHYGGFEFVGCELDEDYFKASVKRIESETSQIDMFSAG